MRPGGWYHPNVTCVLADVLQDPLPDARYDAIVSITALHHAPLAEVLPRLAGASILRASGQGRWYAMERSHAIMPVVLDPSLTTRQVRQQATALLPGAHVRRLVFWRYLLLWQKPIET